MIENKFLRDILKGRDIGCFAKTYYNMDMQEENITKKQVQIAIIHSMLYKSYQTVVVLSNNDSIAIDYLDEVRELIDPVSIYIPKIRSNNKHRRDYENGNRIIVGSDINMIKGRTIDLLHMYDTTDKQKEYFYDFYPCITACKGYIYITDAEGKDLE